MIDVNWDTVLNEIDYKFDSEGSCSIITINDVKYGELKFTWFGNKTELSVNFIDTSVNCICKNPTIASCNCSWLAFQETKDNSRIFSKKEVKNLKQLTLF